MFAVGEADSRTVHLFSFAFSCMKMAGIFVRGHGLSRKGLPHAT